MGSSLLIIQSFGSEKEWLISTILDTQNFEFFSSAEKRISAGKDLQVLTLDRKKRYRSFHLTAFLSLQQVLCKFTAKDPIREAGKQGGGAPHQRRLLGRRQKGFAARREKGLDLFYERHGGGVYGKK